MDRLKITFMLWPKYR